MSQVSFNGSLRCLRATCGIELVDDELSRSVVVLGWVAEMNLGVLGTLANAAVWVTNVAVGGEIVGVWVAQAGVCAGCNTVTAGARALVVSLAGNVGLFTVRDAADDWKRVRRATELMGREGRTYCTWASE